MVWKRSFALFGGIFFAGTTVVSFLPQFRSLFSGARKIGAVAPVGAVATVGAQPALEGKISSVIHTQRKKLNDVNASGVPKNGTMAPIGAVAPIGVQPALKGKISSVIHTQRKKLTHVNASADVCLLDSESMWGTGLHTSPFLGRLKSAFKQLTRDVFTAIQRNTVPCESVTIMVSLFPNITIQGRKRRRSERSISYQYTGQAGCGILVLSDWYAKFLADNMTQNKSLYFWHVIPFATDELLRNIASESKSNEIQRFAKLLKSAVPLYMPREVQRVTYADAKCKLDMFFSMSSKTDVGKEPPADIVTLAHPYRFGKPLKDEFFEARHAMDFRKELRPVYSDIDRLEKFLGQETLSRNVDMGDIQCMTFRKSKAVETFSRRWLWYIATFSMRGQLSWNPALFDCGEGLRIKYLTGGYFNVRHKKNRKRLEATQKEARKMRTTQSSIVQDL